MTNEDIGRGCGTVFAWVVVALGAALLLFVLIVGIATIVTSL